MNVTRNRRRLLAARRYAARQLIPAQRPVPDWAVLSTPYDSGSALRAVEKLACRKESNATHVLLDGHNGREAPCPYHRVVLACISWYNVRYAAMSRLRPPRERDPQHPKCDERTEQ